MLKTFYDSASYNVVSYEGDLQAYRTDRFEGWLRQPAEIGPVLFSNTSPTYANLTLTGSSGGAVEVASARPATSVSPSWAAMAIVLAVFLLGRRRSADERE